MSISNFTESLIINPKRLQGESYVNKAKKNVRKQMFFTVLLQMTFFLQQQIQFDMKTKFNTI